MYSCPCCGALCICTIYCNCLCMWWIMMMRLFSSVFENRFSKIMNRPLQMDARSFFCSNLFTAQCTTHKDIHIAASARAWNKSKMLPFQQDNKFDENKNNNNNKIQQCISNGWMCMCSCAVVQAHMETEYVPHTLLFCTTLKQNGPKNCHHSDWCAYINTYFNLFLSVCTHAHTVVRSSIHIRLKIEPTLRFFNQTHSYTRTNTHRHFDFFHHNCDAANLYINFSYMVHTKHFLHLRWFEGKKKQNAHASNALISCIWYNWLCLKWLEHLHHMPPSIRVSMKMSLININDRPILMTML